MFHSQQIFFIDFIVTVQGSKAVDEEFQPSSDKLTSMDIEKRPPQNREIPEVPPMFKMNF